MSSVQPPPPVKIPSAELSTNDAVTIDELKPTWNPVTNNQRLKLDQQMCLWTLAGLIVLIIYVWWNSLFGWNHSASAPWYLKPFDFNSGLLATWRNDQYSHGWLIPLFTIALLAYRWQRLDPPTVAELWIAVGLMAATMLLRLIFSKYHIRTGDMYTFVPMIGCAFILAGGLKTMRWAAGPVAFLIFMFPLSMAGERWLLLPLKHMATEASVYILQTIGIEAFADGNAIRLGEQSLAVADACSGLRMLTIFVALAVGAIMVLELPWWKSSVILLSTIPIALAVNIIRIVITAVLFKFAESSESLNAASIEAWSHDMAGLLMIPMALGLLFAELQILDRLIVDEDEEPLDLGMGKAGSGLPI